MINKKKSSSKFNNKKKKILHNNTSIGFCTTCTEKREFKLKCIKTTGIIIQIDVAVNLKFIHCLHYVPMYIY